MPKNANKSVASSGKKSSLSKHIKQNHDDDIRQSKQLDELKNDLQELNEGLFGGSKAVIDFSRDDNTLTVNDIKNGIHDLSENIHDNTDETLEKMGDLGLIESIENLFANFTLSNIYKIISNFAELILPNHDFHNEDSEAQELVDRLEFSDLD